MEGKPKNVFHFEVLPEVMKDTAFLDRIHGFIPGWELSRIKQSSIHLSNEFGLISDYFGEVLHRLRSIDYRGYLANKIKFLDEVELRDEKAILKIASGLIKLIFPNLNMSKEELKMIIDIAV